MPLDRCMPRSRSWTPVFAAWNSVERLAQVADQMNHGALVVGSGRDRLAGGQSRQRAGGAFDRRQAGIGDGQEETRPAIRLRMLVWLANTGARSLGGIKAGDLITTGSCTGTIFVEGPCRIAAEFPGRRPGYAGDRVNVLPVDWAPPA